MQLEQATAGPAPSFVQVDGVTETVASIKSFPNESTHAVLQEGAQAALPE